MGVEKGQMAVKERFLSFRGPEQLPSYGNETETEAVADQGFEVPPGLDVKTSPEQTPVIPPGQLIQASHQIFLVKILIPDSENTE